MRFSERTGLRTPKQKIQVDSMDDALRNGIWNVLELFMHDPLRNDTADFIPNTLYADLIHDIWFSFFKEPTDGIPLRKYDVITQIRNRFFKWDWLEVYDYIDFLAEQENSPFATIYFIEALDEILKRELSGYRFINGSLAPITNEGEIREIERALDGSAKSKLKGVKIHLDEALSKLSDRKNPDYRNSIKESISAIESICKVLADDPKAELAKALKSLRGNVSIHGAIEQSFLKMYGFTSDSDGIRHGLLEESNLDQEDALYVLVSCSAFINYLIVKGNKAGISFD
jgi:hypothetical protein